MTERISNVERVKARLAIVEDNADKSRFRRIAKIIDRASAELVVEFHTDRHNEIAKMVNSAIGSIQTALNETIGT